MNKVPKAKEGKDEGGQNKKSAWIVPTVSEYPSRATWETASWERVLSSKRLLLLLVTDHERRAIVLRAAALERLIAGMSYRQIGKELWLSPQTISGVRKALAEKHYRSYLGRSITERKKRKYGSSTAVARVRALPRPEGRPRRTKYGTVYVRY